MAKTKKNQKQKTTENHRWDTVIDQKILEHLDGRGKKKRGWIALHKGVLNGSINYRLALAEQTIFFKLVLLADDLGPVPGLISDNDFRPMPHEHLAHELHCSLEFFEICLKKLKEDDSVYESATHGILVCHFDEYQFKEYDRQKPYRQKWRDEKVRAAMSPKDIAAANAENERRLREFNELRGIRQTLSPQDVADNFEDWKGAKVFEGAGDE